MFVQIYHNMALDKEGRHVGFVDGYQDGHPLVLVASYEKDLSAASSALADAWRLFNVGDDPEFGTPDPLATAYRLRGNRSLSAGDVVRVDDAFYACGTWEPLTHPPMVLDFHGSTPLGLALSTERRLAHGRQ